MGSRNSAANSAAKANVSKRRSARTKDLEAKNFDAGADSEVRESSIRQLSPKRELSRKRDPSIENEDEIATPSGGKKHEVFGIAAFALGLLFSLALFSYDARGGENWAGPVGTQAAAALYSAFGLVCWLLPMELVLLARRFFRGLPAFGWAKAASFAVLLFCIAALLHLVSPISDVAGGHLPGGAVGEMSGEFLRSFMGFAGALVLNISVILVVLVLRTSFSVVSAYEWSATFSLASFLKLKSLSVESFRSWQEARALEEEERLRFAEENAPKIIPLSSRDLAPKRLAPKSLEDTLNDYDPEVEEQALNAVDADIEMVDLDDLESKGLLQDAVPAVVSEIVPAKKAPKAKIESIAPIVLAPIAAPEPVKAATKKAPIEELAIQSNNIAGPTIVTSHLTETPKSVAPIVLPETKPAAKLDITAGDAPATSDEVTAEEMRGTNILSRAMRKKSTQAEKPFVFPGVELLDAPVAQALVINEQELRGNATNLVKKLADYGVKGRVDEIHPGPVVTMYEFEPESGTKISKIASLADDLAMALAAQKVRIVAPIPGKSRVGFELPNRNRQMVALREILADSRWDESKAFLPVAFGKDIAGQPVYGDLAKMPHLLVAGATGAGKSVGLNVMLVSLLMKRSPKEVRMLMIDPKVVELAVFDGIPHMLLPVVTDMKKAALALKWAVDEMERRYQLFAEVGARSIVTYNERVEKVQSGDLALEKFNPKRAQMVKAIGPDGEEVLLPPSDYESPDANEIPEKLPYVVVVVDEFADLMMVAAKDVETAIARLAQKARAAGIHVILATQRPSVDVITGMIKANFPARIGFKVSQREDSKTILGRNGAENLLGQGDMLMIPPGSSDLKRVHCAYISEHEVETICDHLRAQGSPVYDEKILVDREAEEGGEGQSAAASDDPLYDRAVAAVAAAGFCSISHIQRQLEVGYNKAAKLVERMEKDGVVGPASAKAGGRREVLVSSL